MANQQQLGSVQYGHPADCVVFDPNGSTAFDASHWLSAETKIAHYLGKRYLGVLLDVGLTGSVSQPLTMDRIAEAPHHFSRIKSAIRHAESAANREHGSIHHSQCLKRSLYQILQHCFGSDTTNLAKTVQEAVDKIDSLSDLDIEWHYIGQIQSNKTKIIATAFDWVHTVDREKIMNASMRPGQQASEHFNPSQR